MFNPFIDLLAELIQVYMFCIVMWTVLATLISFRIVNKQQELVSMVMMALNRLCGPALYRVRKFVPRLGAIDISPVILLILLSFIRDALYYYFYNMR